MFYLFLIFSFLASINIFSGIESFFVQTVYDDNTFKVEKIEKLEEIKNFDVSRHLSFNNTPEGLKVSHVNTFLFSCHIQNCKNLPSTTRYSAISKLFIKRKIYNPSAEVIENSWQFGLPSEFAAGMKSFFEVTDDNCSSRYEGLKNLLEDYPFGSSYNLSCEDCVLDVEKNCESFFEELLEMYDCKDSNDCSAKNKVQIFSRFGMPNSDYNPCYELGGSYD